jgi:hypothetical protein
LHQTIFASEVFDEPLDRPAALNPKRLNPVAWGRRAAWARGKNRPFPIEALYNLSDERHAAGGFP